MKWNDSCAHRSFALSRARTHGRQQGSDSDAQSDEGDGQLPIDHEVPAAIESIVMKSSGSHLVFRPVPATMSTLVTIHRGRIERKCTQR